MKWSVPWIVNVGKVGGTKAYVTSNIVCPKIYFALAVIKYSGSQLEEPLS